MTEKPSSTGVPDATPSHGLGTVRVRGRSMEPTLTDGDLLLVRWGAAPRAGAVGVVRWPGVPLAVKRLVLRQDDGWWVERDGSEGVDSVTLGTVPDDAVRARVIVRLWPRPGRVPPRPGRRTT